MSFSRAHPQLKLQLQSSFPNTNSKPADQAPASENSISIIDLTQYDDDDDDNGDQIQSSSAHKDFTSFLQHSKEDYIDDFIQRRDEIINKISQISQQAKDENARTTELRRLIFTKPRLQEAICIQNLLKTTNSSFSRQILLKDLTNEVVLSFKCLQDLRNFYHAQNSLSQAEKYRQTSHVIGSTWQQIYQLSIYDPVLVSQVSKLEWIFRAFEVLNHNRDDEKYPYIQYCEVLKQGALASRSERLRESKCYQRIEQELQKSQYLTHKVCLLFEQERNRDLAKQIPKMGVQEAKELLQQLRDFGFAMKQYAQYVEEVLKRSLNIVTKFNEFLRKKALVSSNDLIELMSEIDNSPIKLARIEEHLTKLSDEQKEQVAAVLQETAQRIVEANNEVHLKFANYAKERTIKNGIMIPGAEEVWRTCGQEVQKISKYSEELMRDLPTFTFEDFGRIRRQINKRGYEHIKAELWLAQMKFLQIYCESLIKPANPITFNAPYSFLPEIEDYVESLPVLKRAPFDKQIDFLRHFLREVKTWIAEEQGKQEKTGKISSGRIFYGFIDVTKEMRKPAKKQQKHGNSKLASKADLSQLPSMQILENLDGKGRNETQEVYLCEKIEKIMKKHNEIHQPTFCPFEQEMSQKSQLERVKIEELDEKQIFHYF